MTYTIDRAPSPESPRLGAMTLHPTPESVSRARRWFLKFIAPYGPACSVEDCALMISELVTNAIVYGRSDETWFVRVEWFRDGTALRVEVPAGRRGDARSGLLLVDAIADSWHVGLSPFGGTVVSFTVAEAWPD
ncbi:ATP-binding protein [Streptomyces sp. LaBMicrA B280]|uniref:ATP-binding protein n=1 Tax=Streptomyces sp. LaBMicrA B280 TaxID=3391001 RepID=UPI003BA6AC40